MCLCVYVLGGEDKSKIIIIIIITIIYGSACKGNCCYFHAFQLLEILSLLGNLEVVSKGTILIIFFLYFSLHIHLIQSARSPFRN